MSGSELGCSNLPISHPTLLLSWCSCRRIELAQGCAPLRVCAGAYSLGCAHGMAPSCCWVCSSGKIVSNVVQSTQGRTIHWTIANVRAIRTLLRRGEPETLQFLGVQFAQKGSQRRLLGGSVICSESCGM